MCRSTTSIIGINIHPFHAHIAHAPSTRLATCRNISYARAGIMYECDKCDRGFTFKSQVTASIVTPRTKALCAWNQTVAKDSSVSRNWRPISKLLSDFCTPGYNKLLPAVITASLKRHMVLGVITFNDKCILSYNGKCFDFIYQIVILFVYCGLCIILILLILHLMMSAMI